MCMAGISMSAFSWAVFLTGCAHIVHGWWVTWERIVKPLAFLADLDRLDGEVQPLDTIGDWNFPGDFALVEASGHAIVWWRLVLLDTRDWTEPHVLVDGPQMCKVGTGSPSRCYLHTPSTLKNSYVLDASSVAWLSEVHAGFASYFLLVDPPQLLKSSDAAMQRFSNFEGSEARLHRELAEKALRFQHGQHVFPRCNDLSAPDRHVHRNYFDVPWLLAPFNASNLTIANIGCHTFEESDPIFSLLDSAVPLSGLCVDANVSGLALAKNKLQKHPGVHVLHSFLTPSNIEAIFKEHFLSTKVDVVKIDMDSYHASILDAVLYVADVAVVIAEYEFEIPPPFLYAQHYAGENTYEAKERIGIWGASLSYLVRFMSRKGFLFYKMNENDAVWIHERYQELFASFDTDLRFPVDEWGCYLHTVFYNPNSPFPATWSREWLINSNLHASLQLIWKNVSMISGADAFTLDIAPSTTFAR